MPTSRDDLKALLSSQLAETIGKLWNTDQDKAFLTYNADKIAKYIVISKDPASTDAAKSEAKFNLDMLQASLAAYAAQKAIVAGQSAQEIAKQVVAFAIG